MKKIVEVYRSVRKDGAYLYIEKGYAMDKLPADMRKLLGTLNLALTMILTQEKKLAQVSALRVIEAIDDTGFYLQMPPQSESYMNQIQNDKLPSSPI